MNKFPKVSILVITYNQKSFIHETITSALAQDYPNFEYIIADDGSSDGTADVIESYAIKHPGIIIPITREANVGITRNSNRGLKRCTGKYIALQGGDDVFFPSKIRKQVEWLESDPDRTICGHLLKLCDEDSRAYGVYKIQKKTGRGPKEWIKRGPLYGATSVMMRANCLPSFGFDERLPVVSDWKLYVDSLGPKCRYGYINEFLGMYRKHPENITKNKPLVMKDAAKTIDLFEESDIYETKWIKSSRANILLYGEAIHHLQGGDEQKAMKMFIQSIARDPAQWKAYVRLIQVVLIGLVRKLKP